MKKRRLVPLLLAAALSAGCAAADPSSLLEEEIAAGTRRQILSANHSTRYISYYLQPSFGIMEQEDTCTVFNISGMKLYMNIRAEKVIQDAYYSDVSEELPDGAAYTASGTYSDVNEEAYSYEAAVYESGSTSVLFLRTEYADFLAQGRADEVCALAEEAICIARSLSVDTAAITDAYSLREEITYSTDTLELFETLVPEEGSIEEILTEHASATASPGTQDSE